METQHIKIYDMQRRVLRRSFISLNLYIKEKERFQIYDLTLHLKELEEGQTTSKEKINEMNCFFFEKK